MITGASTGIGEQLAYEYSKLGAKVLITARREHVLQKVSEFCASSNYCKGAKSGLLRKRL